MATLGNSTMTYHVVCHDCPYEFLRSDEDDANNLTVAHAYTDGHNVEYAMID